MGDQEEVDIYSRVDYRRMVAWPQRIQREAPFLRRVFARVPERSVLDLGCGTGEHCRFLADEGFRVLGVDREERMLEAARESPPQEGLDYLCADLRQLDRHLEDRFGAALSLGNTVVHMRERAELADFLKGLRRHLLPGAPFLFQILNYERIFGQNIRYLPLNFRRSDEGEIIFLRLMEPLAQGRVLFCPTTLKYDPESEQVVEVVRSKKVELQGWQRSDLFPLLQKYGFEVAAVYGNMEAGSFDPEESTDLVVVAHASCVL